MLHKTSSDIRCVICGAPADTRIEEQPVCAECASKQETKDYFDNLKKFD